MSYNRTEITCYVFNEQSGEVEFTNMPEVIAKAEELFGEDANIVKALEFAYFGYCIEDDELIELSKHFPDIELRVWLEVDGDELIIYSCKNGVLKEGKIKYEFFNFNEK